MIVWYLSLINCQENGLKWVYMTCLPLWDKLVVEPEWDRISPCLAQCTFLEMNISDLCVSETLQDLFLIIWTEKDRGIPGFVLSMKPLTSPLLYYMLCGLWLMPSAFSSTWEAPAFRNLSILHHLPGYLLRAACPDQTHTPGIIPLASKNPESSVSCMFFVLMGEVLLKKRKMIV